jgi:tRNA(Ile)-lysidine synthase
MLAEGGGVVLAVSGGVDSVVLLDLLAEEQHRRKIRLVVAHFNHRLRGAESDGDERFVVDLAHRYGCEAYVERADTGERARQEKRGIQETARSLRYAFFERLRVSLGFDVIATAHNADDNAETIILHLFRGTGLRGLGGIPSVREAVVRPLLFATRAEIETYAAERRLPFRVDSSNETDHYTRNVIRHHIIPRAQSSINPSLVDTLVRSSELFREVDTYLRRTADDVVGHAMQHREDGEADLPLEELSGLPVLLQQYVLMQMFARVVGTEADQSVIASLQGLHGSGTGSWATLRDGWEAHRDRDRIVFRKRAEQPDFWLPVEWGTEYEVGRFRFRSELVEGSTLPDGKTGNVEFVDADRLGGERLILRTWKDGDWFVPLGLGGRKKVSDYLVDAHVPRYLKRHVPVLTTAAGDVVWLCGKRLDDRFKLTESTRRMGRLAFEPRESERTDAAIDQGQR